jgi:site-specific DNA-methyltransferase (adenine-specific)
LQKRKRDEFGKSVYARDENGIPISNGDKKGVPASDVWDIPFLNPKAKERVGYPTQKPILLLERIIQISTDQGDTVLDPFCGSGTTLLAADLLNRHGIGIDISSDAVKLVKERLENPIKSKSHLMEVGRDAYRVADENALSYLKGLDFVPVQRNYGIDAFLKVGLDSGSIPVRVQRAGESLVDAASALHKAAKTKEVLAMILIATQIDLGFDMSKLFPEIIIVDTAANAISKVVRELKQESANRQTYSTSRAT